MPSEGGASSPPIDGRLTLEMLQKAGEGGLPGLIGIRVLDVTDGIVRAKLEVGPMHQAPNGYLHAAVLVALADTACGYGCMLNLPEGAVGFTTVELKTNFLGTARAGEIACESRLVHGGATTQVWDSVVTNADGKKLSLFRCTQLLLYPNRQSIRT